VCDVMPLVMERNTVSNGMQFKKVALFDVTYKMHAFHPRQYIYIRYMWQARQSEASALWGSPCYIC